jgi:hypothetical protein
LSPSAAGAADHEECSVLAPLRACITATGSSVFRGMLRAF